MNRWRKFQFGAGTARVGYNGSFMPDLVTRGSEVGGGETSIKSVILPPNSFSRDGVGVRIKTWGIVAANANEKRIRLYLAGQEPNAYNESLICDSGPITSNGVHWSIEAVCYRVASRVQKAHGRYDDGLVRTVLGTDCTLKEEFGILVWVGGGQVAQDDVVGYGLTVEALNQ